MAARTCMASYDDCEEGRTTFTSCLERVRAACADGATDRYCQDPVAFCEYRASEASECFDACHSLVRTARRTCAAETDARDGDDCPHHDGDRDGDGETDGRDGTGDTGDTGDRDGDGETDGRDGTGDTDDTDDTDGDGR